MGRRRARDAAWIRDPDLPIPSPYPQIRETYGEQVASGDLSNRTLRGKAVVVDGHEVRIGQTVAETAVWWIRTVGYSGISPVGTGQSLPALRVYPA